MDRVFQVIHERRSVRRSPTEPVDDAIIGALVDAEPR